MLLVYPRAFRSRFAGDMGETFAQAAREARRKGMVHLLRFWMATVYEVTVFAAAEWRDLVRARLRPSSRSHGPLPPSRGTSRARSRLRLTLVHDMQYAVRALLRRPLFAIAAVSTLGLGIGANTAVFSVVHGIMWKPLSYSQPEELIAVWTNNTMSLPRQIDECFTAAPAPAARPPSTQDTERRVQRARGAHVGFGSIVHLTPCKPDTKSVPKASDGVRKPESADTSPVNTRVTEETAASAVNA